MQSIISLIQPMILSERDFLFQISMVRWWIQSERILEDCCSCCRRRRRRPQIFYSFSCSKCVLFDLTFQWLLKTLPHRQQKRFVCFWSALRKQANLPLQIFSLVLTYSLSVHRVQWTRQSLPRNLDILQTRRFSLANISSSSTLQWVTRTSHND